MSEFKGTKGKWKYEHIETDSAMFHCVCKDTEVITFVLGDEIKANALLISKAPEMLEMIIELKRRIDIVHTEPNGLVRETMINNLDLGIDMLIKEATEL